MSFEYRSEDGSVVDHGRHLSLRRLGGRDEENYVVFRFSAPDCCFDVMLYYHYAGLEFTYPGIYDELGRETAVISYTSDAAIELQFGGFELQDGSGDPLNYTADVKAALASHYTFNGRYNGPVSIIAIERDGEITRKRITSRAHPSALFALNKRNY